MTSETGVYGLPYDQTKRIAASEILAELHQLGMCSVCHLDAKTHYRPNDSVDQLGGVRNYQQMEYCRNYVKQAAENIIERRRKVIEIEEWTRAVTYFEKLAPSGLTFAQWTYAYQYDAYKCEFHGIRFACVMGAHDRHSFLVKCCEKQVPWAGHLSPASLLFLEWMATKWNIYDCRTHGASFYIEGREHHRCCEKRFIVFGDSKPKYLLQSTYGDRWIEWLKTHAVPTAVVKMADPELERLLAEEEAIEAQDRLEKKFNPKIQELREKIDGATMVHKEDLRKEIDARESSESSLRAQISSLGDALRIVQSKIETDEMRTAVTTTTTRPEEVGKESKMYKSFLCSATNSLNGKVYMEPTLITAKSQEGAKRKLAVKLAAKLPSKVDIEDVTLTCTEQLPLV